jgi:glycosyltransferase involved in cell wall biosynthesis
MTKLLSILIPVFNGEKHVYQCLEKIVNDSNQSDYIYELVIVDDGSLDASVELIQNFELPSHFTLKLLRNRNNKGISYSLRKGLANCTGDYIFRIDIDDRWISGRFKNQILFMDNNLDVILSGGRMIGSYSRKIYKQRKMSGISILDFMISSPVFHPTFCIRNNSVLTLMYNVNSPFDDFHSLLSVVISGYKVANITQVLVEYNDFNDDSRLSIIKKHPREVKFFLVRFILLFYTFRSYIKRELEVEKIITVCSNILQFNIRRKRLLRLFGPLAYSVNAVIYKIFNF